jgi:hypothetical protein
MRAALGVDLAIRPAGHPKIAHRRNNIATVLLMLGRLDDARDEVGRAWQITAGRYDLTSARILAIRWTVATLAGEPAGPFLGQLKTLVVTQPLPDYADVSPCWQVRRLVEALSRVLAQRDAALLRGIGDVLNGDRPVDSLNEIATWRNAPPVALEAPWPGAAAA